jgi:hypothetical protein
MKKNRTTKQFDDDFEKGVDITGSLALGQARRVNQAQKRVNVDFPIWMIEELDREANRLGIPRQSLIKTLVAKHYKKTAI